MNVTAYMGLVNVCWQFLAKTLCPFQIIKLNFVTILFSPDLENVVALCGLPYIFNERHGLIYTSSDEQVCVSVLTIFHDVYYFALPQNFRNG